ncbi:hypothetical protein CDR19_10995 [Ectopseudomonas toyotomiensis]|uniref:Uncharacterized protein n=1 Tax=Ectopseudomonas toyotomiensis TaxID=554344 RepID=A0A1I5UPL9_9GAMM|nr:hypothetical protein CDR19_10995 [Pseudomonas toyotomiensis]SFP97185.1 hypothetical protein SAMN05216177_106354 [Pseudomonas toyotomiensis]
MGVQIRGGAPLLQGTRLVHGVCPVRQCSALCSPDEIWGLLDKHIHDAWSRLRERIRDYQAPRMPGYWPQQSDPSGGDSAMIDWAVRGVSRD